MALHALALLDTDRDERYDRYTRLAEALCDVPISVVSLVDENRQWFKSCVGLAAQQTGRDISFCGHAILENGVFYIPDTLADPRFADNPLVVGPPNIRCYAGCPLFLYDRLPIGTLCVIDTRPREFTSAQTLRLRDLADCLQRELLLELLKKDIASLHSSPALAALAAVARSTRAA